MANFAPVRLAHQVFEPEGGYDQNSTPIIFIHGITAIKEIWEDIPQKIADKSKRKTYAYDARNHGDSEYTDAFNFDLNVDDLFYFMNTMNIQKAILVGHSMGGLTATNAALRKPERIEMVFIEDMFVKRIPQELWTLSLPILALRNESMQHIPKELNETEALRFSADYMYNKLPENTPLFAKKEDVYQSKTFFKRKPDGGYVLNFNVDAVIRALKNNETLMSEPSGQYNGPSYFIYGNKSPLRVGSQEEHIRKHFPKAELIEFDGATHSLHSEFPDKFIDTILHRLQQK